MKKVYLLFSYIVIFFVICSNDTALMSLGNTHPFRLDWDPIAIQPMERGRGKVKMKHICSLSYVSYIVGSSRVKSKITLTWWKHSSMILLRFLIQKIDRQASLTFQILFLGKGCKQIFQCPIIIH